MLRSARTHDVHVRGGGLRAHTLHLCKTLEICDMHVRACWRGAYASLHSCRIARTQSKNGEMGFCGALASLLAEISAWKSLVDTLPTYSVPNSRGGPAIAKGQPMTMACSFQRERPTAGEQDFAVLQLY